MTAHPEWRADVGSVACETRDDLILFDPLVLEEDALDGLVRRTAKPVSILVTVYWLQEHRALVPGDVILGAEGGGLRLCPPSWLPASVKLGDLAASLRPALELPVVRVLVSHGEPVLRRGREALARALDHAPSAA